MEVQVELEDDLFFADLSKQISLLIMDDDEEDNPAIITHSSPSLSLQSMQHPAVARCEYVYDQAWLRESKGTGVFIPQSLMPPRRKRRNFKSANSDSVSKSRRQNHHHHHHHLLPDSTRMKNVQAASDVSFQPKEVRRLQIS